MEAIKGISGLHHYCRIPVLRMRYIREQDAYKKDWLLKLIIDEANYVTASSKPDAPLVAAAYLEKARALVDKRQEGKAIAEYHNVLRNNPKDATPYLDLARLFVKLDNRAKALEIVTEGLRHNSSKGLKRYYLELGGKEPYPTPYLERAAPAINALQPQAPLASPKAEPQTPVHSPAEQSLAPPREAPKPPLENPVDEKNSLGKSYCRFCP